MGGEGENVSNVADRADKKKGNVPGEGTGGGQLETRISAFF